MIISVDYDGTYTADPELWDDFIKSALVKGHTVICITARTETIGQVVKDSIGQLVPIIFTGGQPKRQVAFQQGYQVDVWIDDMPQIIDAGCILVDM
jgi:hypothetical protein